QQYRIGSMGISARHGSALMSDQRRDRWLAVAEIDGHRYEAVAKDVRRYHSRQSTQFCDPRPEFLEMQKRCCIAARSREPASGAQAREGTQHIASRVRQGAHAAARFAIG